MKRFVLVGLLLSWATLSLGQTPEQKKATVEYVRTLSTKPGGQGPFRLGVAIKGDEDSAPDLSSTNAALRALKYFGGKLKSKDDCVKFVDSCFDPGTGGFARLPGQKPTALSTAVGLMAVVELGMPREKYEQPGLKFLGIHASTFEEIRLAAAAVEAVGKQPDKADAWLAQVLKMRNPNGIWGEGAGAARATGEAVALVLRLGGKLDKKEEAVKAMKAGQQEDGGFGVGGKGSNLGLCYRIVRSLHMLKEKPADVKGLREFIARCRNKDGGYGLVPGTPSNVAGTYYAGIILHWLED
jgi:hypothetical protein